MEISLQKQDVPVLLLTGYLGSGKTTLLNRILSNKKGIKFAVIVNDIGEVNIDASLIEKGGIVGGTDDSLVALQNGCICFKSVTVTTTTSKALALYGGTTAFSGYSDTSGRTSFGSGTTTGSSSTFTYTWSDLDSQKCTHVLLKP